MRCIQRVRLKPHTLTRFFFECFPQPLNQYRFNSFDVKAPSLQFGAQFNNFEFGRIHWKYFKSPVSTARLPGSLTFEYVKTSLITVPRTLFNIKTARNASKVTPKKMADIGRENGGVFLKFLLIPNTAMQVSQLQSVTIKKYTIHSYNLLRELNQIICLIRNLRLIKLKKDNDNKQILQTSVLSLQFHLFIQPPQGLIQEQWAHIFNVWCRPLLKEKMSFATRFVCQNHYNMLFENVWFNQLLLHTIGKAD